MALQFPFAVEWLQLLHPSLVLLLLFIFTLLFVLRLNRIWTKEPNLPPSPPKLPIIGNLHQLGPQANRSLHDLSNKYGTFMLLQLGYVQTLVVSSAEMAKEILKTHDIAFANRFFSASHHFLMYQGTDILCSPYGEYWKKVRKICVTELLGIRRVQSFKTVREEEVNIMIQGISRSCSKGAPINLTEMIMEISNSIISKCALGSKHKGEDGKNKFGKLVREFVKVFETVSIGNLFPWLQWIDIITGFDRRMKKISRKLDTYFDKIIDEHLTRSRHDDDPDYRKDFVDLLLHAQKYDILDMQLTRNNIKAIIMDMFVAGTDTSSSTIEWAISELLRHPNIMKKAQEEVRRVVGKKSKVDEEDINQMDYLKYVLKETLRLHPPGTFLLRASPSMTSTNVKGYHIPPNTKVLINLWAIQRDPKVWDRPEEFIPERFMGNTMDFKGQHYEFMPFGSGLRICPGISFGITEVEFIVANLLYWYDWKFPGGAREGELDMTESGGYSVMRKFPLHLIPVLHFR